MKKWRVRFYGNFLRKPRKVKSKRSWNILEGNVQMNLTDIAKIWIWQDDNQESARFRRTVSDFKVPGKTEKKFSEERRKKISNWIWRYWRTSKSAEEEGEYESSTWGYYCISQYENNIKYIYTFCLTHSSECLSDCNMGQQWTNCLKSNNCFL